MALFFFYITNIPKISTSIYKPPYFNNPNTEILLVSNDNIYSVTIDTVICKIDNIIKIRLHENSTNYNKHIIIPCKSLFRKPLILPKHSTNFFVQIMDSINTFITLRTDESVCLNITFEISYKPYCIYGKHKVSSHSYSYVSNQIYSFSFPTSQSAN
jgi:hypothetical protein